MGQSRETAIIKASRTGILVNSGLAAIKGLLGLLSGSVALTADAANNLSDMIASVLTLVTAKASARKPDRLHPFGHGRLEYIASVFIGSMILLTGMLFIKESCVQIFHPAQLRYSLSTLFIMACGIGVKTALGQYFTKKGQLAGSDVLQASGKDSFCDALISSAVALSAILYIATGLNLEGYVGTMISLVILWNGLQITGNAVNMLLGPCAEREIYEKVKAVIHQEPEVLSLDRLILHNYGPERLVGSVNIQVPGDLTASQIAALEQKTMQNVARECSVTLTSIGVYIGSENN